MITLVAWGFSSASSFCILLSGGRKGAKTPSSLLGNTSDMRYDTIGREPVYHSVPLSNVKPCTFESQRAKGSANFATGKSPWSADLHDDVEAAFCLPQHLPLLPCHELWRPFLSGVRWSLGGVNAVGCLAICLKPKSQIVPECLIQVYQVSKKPQDSAYFKVETSSVDEDFHCNALTSARQIVFLWEEMLCFCWESRLNGWEHVRFEDCETQRQTQRQTDVEETCH